MFTMQVLFQINKRDANQYNYKIKFTLTNKINKISMNLQNTKLFLSMDEPYHKNADRLDRPHSIRTPLTPRPSISCCPAP